MKRLVTLIGVVLAALLFTTVINAQTATNAAAPWYHDLVGFEQHGSTNKQLTLAVFPNYAPGLTVDGARSEWGAGAALLYPVPVSGVGDYAFVGGRIDYLAGAFWAPSVNLTLKADIQIAKVNFTPFVLGGAIFPLDDISSDSVENNRDVGAIVGAGVYTTFWKGKVLGFDSSLQAFFKYERWFNLDANIYSPGVAFTASF
mgnify:CR=1 FL=1